MASLGDLMIRLGMDTTAFNAALGGIEGRLKQASADAEKAWAPLANVGQSLMGIGAGLTAAVTVPLAGIAAESIKVAENLNLATLAFTTMLGSAEKAKTFLAELQAFAASTPFEFPELVTAAKRMMAMGFESNQVLPTLRSIGDAAAALGGGAEFINGVTMALGQMQAKGKVSAEEMNQLAERGIPAWKLLADQIGKSIPEAMKLAEKGAIKAADAIPAILQGMNDKFGGQMAKTSQTLTGVWSNFKDQVTLVLADVGKQLTPIATDIVKSLTPVLQWAKDGVTWFTQLPEPVRNAGLAFAGMMAVIGPMTLALGGIATGVAAIGTAIGPIAAVLGVTTTAFLGWAAAIPLVVAALVALGSWVNDNWEPITATVLQAWDGLTDMWSAQWEAASQIVTGAMSGLFGFLEPIIDPLQTLVSGMWDGLKKQWDLAWSGLTAIFTPVWNAIKAGFTATFNGISEVLKTFLGWAEKIPGVNKLMNLDEAWASSKKLSEQTKKTTEATANLAKQADKTGASHKKFGITLGQTTAEKKKAEAAAKALVTAQDKLEHSTFKNNQATSKFLNELDKWQEKHQPALTATKSLNEAIQAMEIETVSAGKQLTVLAEISGRQLTDALKAPINPITDLEAAFKTLGISSSQAVKQSAEEARKAYETIKNSGMGSARDLDAAWVKYEEARIEAARAAGQTIPRETEAALAKVKEQLSGKQGTGAWSDWSKQVSTIITDWSRDTGKILFDGDLSWGKKFEGIIGGLGEAMTRMFVEPAQKALGDFMAGTIQDLIGGKGFGGLIDRVKQLGDTISDVFGAGTDVASTVGGNTPTPGGNIPGAPSGGAAGAGAKGVMGAVNLVTGIVSAVSDVITAIYAIRQEGTLNAIEHNTRYGMMYLGERSDGGILGQMFRIADTLEFGVMVKATERSRDLLSDYLPGMTDLLSDLNTRFQFAVDRLDQIGHNALYGSGADLMNTSLLREIAGSVRERQPVAVSITVSGAGNPNEVANRIATTLRTQFA